MDLLGCLYTVGRGVHERLDFLPDTAKLLGDMLRRLLAARVLHLGSQLSSCFIGLLKSLRSPYP